MSYRLQVLEALIRLDKSAPLVELKKELVTKGTTAEEARNLRLALRDLIYEEKLLGIDTENQNRIYINYDRL